MTEKQVALVLGGTSPHIELIRKLKARGYHVILVDYLDNPPARKHADLHIKESTLDKELILSLAREYNAALVISTCIDQANSVCCYVAEKLGLPHPYSYSTSLDVTDKGLMKKIMVDNGIPTSHYMLVTDVEDVDWSGIVYPSVVKPVDCNSSKGVCRVDSKEEAVERLLQALGMSRSGCAIIEGFNEGNEIQVDCAATPEGVKVVLTRQKQRIVADGNRMVLQSFGSIFPAPLDDELKHQAVEIAQKIADAFGLHNTPFFYQAIVTEEGIKVLEFAPRIGGGLSYYVLKELAGFDAVEAAVQSFVGEPVTFSGKQLSGYFSSNIIYMKPGVFDHISGLEKMKQNGLVYEMFMMKSKGDEVDGDMRSSNRVAAFIVNAASTEELYAKASEVFSGIEVYSTGMEPLLNRSVYPFNNWKK